MVPSVDRDKIILVMSFQNVYLTFKNLDNHKDGNFEVLTRHDKFLQV